MKLLQRNINNLLILLLGIVFVNSGLAATLIAASPTIPPPSHPIGGGDLWGVELDTVAHPDVLCLDGTNPVFYVDEAVNGPSNNWVFFLQGGGSCANAQDCVETYFRSTERTEMSSRWAPLSISGKGILNPNPSQASNDFADFNRVKIHKCSYDRWMGNKSQLNADVTVPGGSTISFNLHFHGRKIVKAVLNQLANGISYHDQTCSSEQDCRTLPPLQEANIILLTGASGGGVGLIHAVDDLASEIRGIQAGCAIPPCEEADIRTVIDAAFMPGIDAEYRYSALDPPGEMNFINAFGQAETAFFDLQTYTAPSGDIFTMQEVWRDNRDSSCELQHGPNHPLCEDHLHVLRYHVETPLFIRQDLEDQNLMHLNQGNGWTPFWTRGNHVPVGTNDYTSRVIFQALMYADLKIDELPVMIFAPTCQQHVGLTHDGAFYIHSISDTGTGLETNFHDALSNWVLNPGEDTLIGVDDGINYNTGNC